VLLALSEETEDAADGVASHSLRYAIDRQSVSNRMKSKTP